MSAGLPSQGARTALALVVCAGVIIGFAMGTRHVQGVFLPPMVMAHGWTREDFALALAVQNLVWGLAQPAAGMVADRYGTTRVAVAGCVLYAAGLLLQQQAQTPLQLLVGAGVVIGLALSATSFAVVYGAVSRLSAPERRSWALGVAGAVAGLMQFLLVPGVQAFIGGMGWPAALLALALLGVLVAPLARALDDRSVTAQAGGAALSMRAAIGQALTHKGFWLLNAGFLACGFHLAFIAGHLPAYLMDRGLNASHGVTALALIALANIAGTYLCGYLGGRYRRKYLLAGLYAVRTAAIAVFLLLPVSAPSLYLFAVVMGLTWLGTVPLTNGLLSQMFGVRYIATLFGFVFLGHQLGSFLGVWLGGWAYDRAGSYLPVWLACLAIGLIAVALHLPIDDREVAPAAARPA
ncbi:MFS transporter [Orrella sp. JC864]|uniref:MFS transporter n=1 Tax=Orrella sp. JC864 TaxID=3120298 RepID=UPI0012BC6B7C